FVDFDDDDAGFAGASGRLGGIDAGGEGDEERAVVAAGVELARADLCENGGQDFGLVGIGPVVVVGDGGRISKELKVRIGVSIRHAGGCEAGADDANQHLFGTGTVDHETG